MFESTLLESAGQHRPTRRRIALPLSLTAHALVLGAGIGASVWFIEDVPEPPIPVTFYVPGAPPPPAGTLTGTPKNVEKHRSPTSPRTSPRRIPDTPSLTTETSPLTAVHDPISPEDRPRDDPPGVPWGLWGGTGDPSTQGTAAVGDSETIHVVGGEVKEPQLIKKIDPPYPESARKPRLEEVVILEAIITATGNVAEVKVLKSAHPILDDAARQALLGWRYKPATLNGRAVPVFLTVTVKFILH